MPERDVTVAGLRQEVLRLTVELQAARAQAKRWRIKWKWLRKRLAMLGVFRARCLPCRMLAKRTSQ